MHVKDEKKQTYDGILLVDKPQNMTSHDVVSVAKTWFRPCPVGHSGTLDPMATGLLILLIGEATKFSSFFLSEQKEYTCTIQLGIETDTLDADGAFVCGSALSEKQKSSLIEAEKNETSEARTWINVALAKEKKRTLQIPPRYSAIKLNGKKAYKEARKGHELELPARPVSVFDLNLKSILASQESICLQASVSKGYYMRSLARDFSESLQTKGHLSSLRRLRSGAFKLDEATPLAELQSSFQSNKAFFFHKLIPINVAIRQIVDCFVLTEKGVHLAKVGKEVPDECILRALPKRCADDEGKNSKSFGPFVALLNQDECCVALAERREGRFKITRGINTLF